MRIPADLTHARILVSNDDGIHAPGIEVLARAMQAFSDDVWTIAPETEQSGVAHSLTLHEPLRIRQLKERRYAVSGTPTDCVLLGVREVIGRDHPPALVVSGVNRGCNVADDVTYSGTIAAAMEAALLDLPAIAFSQHCDEAHGPTPWATAEFYLPLVIEKLAGFDIPRGHLLNVNFPNVAPGEAKGIRVAPQGQRKIADKLVKRADPKGRPYYWIGTTGFNDLEDYFPDSDHVLLKEGYITLTPLQLDLTSHTLLAEMAEVFGKTA